MYASDTALATFVLAVDSFPAMNTNAYALKHRHKEQGQMLLVAT